MDHPDTAHALPGNAAWSRRRVVASLLVLFALTSAAIVVAVPEEGGASGEASSAADDAYVARFRRAQRLMGSGSDDEAEKIFRELIAERGEESSVHHALGLLLQFRGRPSEATAALVRAAELAPEIEPIQRDAGQHLLAVAGPVRALPYLTAAVRLDPTDVDAAVSLGIALRGAGRTADAIVAYRKALAEQPESVDARAGLAACLLPTEPAAALALVEPLAGRWADVVLVRGLALMRLERFDRAVKELAQVRDVAPPGRAGAPFCASATEALVLCGDVAAALPAAEDWFRREQAEGGASIPASFALAEVKAARRDWAGALAALAAPIVEKDAPAAPRAPLRLLEAAVLVRSGRADAAKSVLEGLAALEDDLFERAAARRLLGTLDAATLNARRSETDRANDVEWVESLAAEMAGDAEAARTARERCARLSKPRGEHPGILALPSPAK